MLVDLKRRSLAMPDLDDPALGANILSSFTALHRWDVCGGCEAARGLPDPAQRRAACGPARPGGRSRSCC